MTNSNRIRIRELRKEDCMQLWKLHSELFPVEYPYSYILSFLNNSSYCIVATVKNEKNTDKIIAFVSLHLEWKSVFSTDRTAYVSTFGVIEEKRRSKIGSDIMNVIFDVMLKHYKIHHMYLHMQQSNLAAKNYYLNTGWKITKDLKDFYHIKNQCNDAYYMTYDIPDNFVPLFKNMLEIDQSIQKKVNAPQNLAWISSFFKNK
ncbi:acetyltransferase, GNAT family protein [Trichomonas vaginalis G3]|uniref:N-alpha-acetyltransferase 60 n=1 Tax=Trichomonas vaginalis (strain ATCC PRA-98 / G3) TaxID=412133 RepID=A2DPD4_TRIV3|nr:peptide alpha-N-acetyltransferase protein [Trichomonas vaginalis G3]EAY17678.1 acetyltransferase, GNAT family protein [Trichomonas vaginalis G3]KAI5507918.1 peptide alpha-N-acetyltransferase protein [Trichomonas vaginalis G3]|eukprot:XP_001329813.1 acetyltransferase, GNAT family protein [Trichomonas vaginalis G3]